MTRKNNGGGLLVKGVRVSSYIVYEFVMSVILGIIAFAFLAIIVFALDKSHMLSSINALMGASIKGFTVSGLLSLSGLFAVLLTVSRIVTKALWILVSNAAMTMLGGIEIVTDNRSASTDVSKSIGSNGKPGARKVASSNTGVRV
jgi:hypothetical protein